MVFSSTVFVFLFLPVVLAVYFISGDRLKNIVLLVASLLFYAWGEPKFVFLMLLSIAVNYAFGRLIAWKEKWKSAFLVLDISYNLGALFLFKYLKFAADILNRISGADLNISEIAPVIGLSFYTFQILSYVIDVYRGKTEVQKNILNLALYVSLFPQLVAGPIVRYTDIAPQIEKREHSWDRFSDGITRFAVGFSKKILIADVLAPLVDDAFSGTYPSFLVNWIGIIAYALQIYFDFSGYSDMAIGLGKIFGFDFLENFDFPYISQSVREFWRRWHISLGSWFRDYLYIPLGGNRKGMVRTCINLMIVFFLTGLWHGASLHFIAWGLFYAVFLIAERAGLGKVLQKMPRFLRHIYAILLILIGWVFFRADGIHSALKYIAGMFVPAGNDVIDLLAVMNREYWLAIIAGICLSIPHNRLKALAENHRAVMIVGDVLLILVFILALCYMVGSGYSPFLYFRF